MNLINDPLIRIRIRESPKKLVEEVVVQSHNPFQHYCKLKRSDGQRNILIKEGSLMRTIVGQRFGEENAVKTHDGFRTGLSIPQDLMTRINFSNRINLLWV